MSNKSSLMIDSSLSEGVKFFSTFSRMNGSEQRRVLTEMNQKGESLSQLAEFLAYFKQFSQTISHSLDVLDIVGTGGDKAGTFNISTAASLLAASGGLQVAKHGGRSATSQSGSTDVISALGIRMPEAGPEALLSIQQNNYVYLSAPTFNPELKKYALLRKSISHPTIFNVIGPLLNPMQPKRMLIGVYRKDLIDKVTDILLETGVKRALIVHSDEGLDEICIVGKTFVNEIRDGNIHSYVLTPEMVGLNRGTLFDLKGGTPDENAELITQILSGKIDGPKRDIVLLNAGAALYLSDKVGSIKEGVAIASALIETGEAFQLIERIREKDGE